MSTKTKQIVKNIERLDANTLNKALAGRFDESQSAFLARQLTYIRSQVLQVKHAPLNAFTVFPVMTDIPQGAETALQRVYDMVGMAKIISNPADDLPMADPLAQEWPVNVKELGAAYGYSVRDLEAAAFSRTPLSKMKADAAKQAIDIKLNKLAWNGDKANKIIGFLNNENMSEYTLTADGASNATTLASKTAEKMYRDVANLIESIGVNTNEVEDANTVLFAPAVYRALSTTLYTTDNGQTTQFVLKMLQANYPQITRWLKVGELHNADDTGTKDMMIAGCFDPLYIRFEIPLRFEQRPVQENNLYFKIPCRATTVGVTIFRPYCFTKAIGA